LVDILSDIESVVGCRVGVMIEFDFFNVQFDLPMLISFKSRE